MFSDEGRRAVDRFFGAFVGVAIVVLRVLSLPGDEDEEEFAWMIAGNWDRLDHN